MENESVGKNNGVATIPFAAYQAAEVRRYSRRGGSYRMSYDDGSYRGGGSYDDGMSYDGGGSYRRGRDRMGRFVSRSGDDMIERLKDMRDETDDPNERKEFDAFIKSIERRG